MQEFKKLIINKMINDYECPRCHNKFPSQNVVMHDRMCTEENPMALDKSRQLEIKESNNSNNNMQISNSNVNISQEKPPEEIKKSEISESIPNVQESQLQKSSQSGEFPDVFTCEICHEVLPESEKKDHMYCHDLQKEENNAPDNEFRITQSQIDNQREIERQIKRENEERRQQQQNQRNQNAPRNEDEFRITQSQIENQREIERQIKRENEERRQQQQNQRNQERRRNENQTGNNRNNRNNRDNRNNRNVNLNNNVHLNNFFEEFSNLNMNNQNRNIPSRGGGVRQVRIEIGGPNGPRVVQQFSSNDNGNINNMMDPINMFFNNNSINMSSRRTIPFMDFANQSFGFNIQDLVERLRNRDNPTDQEILNELPETTIDDVNKLDPEKRNCVICLEDFKNGDKATVLPCIHLFHTLCIQNWLKTQNSCPICKFKLTGENLNPQS